MATHFSILSWEIPWTEGSGGLQSMGSQTVGHDLVTKQHGDEKLACRCKGLPWWLSGKEAPCQMQEMQI